MAKRKESPEERARWRAQMAQWAEERREFELIVDRWRLGMEEDRNRRERRSRRLRRLIPFRTGVVKRPL